MALDGTYAGLVASIEAWATYNQSQYIPDFVAWASQEIGRRLRSNLILAREDITIDGEFESVPADFGAIKTFRLDLDQRIKLKTVGPEQAEDICAEWASQTYPQFVAVEGADFHFAPEFTGSATGKLLYYAIPEALTEDSDTNAVLVKYPFLYLYGSLEALYRFMEDDTQADRYGGLFGALIEDINSQEMADALSGQLQVQVTPGRVV